jgi:hypothetical protein
VRARTRRGFWFGFVGVEVDVERVGARVGVRDAVG